jgi:putative FmdB family regulatory protein
MPLYEYRCSKCGNVFEKIQKFSDAPLTVHEDCGGAVEKLISRSAFALKGSGWYATDYAKGSSSKPSGSESKSDSGSDSKADSKSSDSKPAESTTSESKPAESKPVSTTTKSDS